MKVSVKWGPVHIFLCGILCYVCIIKVSCIMPVIIQTCFLWCQRSLASHAWRECTGVLQKVKRIFGYFTLIFNNTEANLGLCDTVLFERSCLFNNTCMYICTWLATNNWVELRTRWGITKLDNSCGNCLVHLMPWIQLLISVGPALNMPCQVWNLSVVERDLV